MHADLESRFKSVELLRAARVFLPLTEISKATRIPLSMLSRYANGASLPSDSTARKLLDYLLSKETLSSIVAKAVRVYNGYYNISSLLLDPKSLRLIGEYVVRRFNGMFDRILTPEAGGISLATAIGLVSGAPIVVARRQRPPTEDQVLEVMTTSGPASYQVFYATRRELPKGSKVLIVDDFSIHGHTLRALAQLVRKAGAHIAGAMVVVGVGDDWKIVDSAEALIEING